MKTTSLRPSFFKGLSRISRSVLRANRYKYYQCSGETFSGEGHILTEAEIRNHNRLASQSTLERYTR